MLDDFTFKSLVILLHVNGVEPGLCCSESFLSRWPGSNINSSSLLTGGNIFATVCLEVVFSHCFLLTSRGKRKGQNSTVSCC